MRKKIDQVCVIVVIAVIAGGAQAQNDWAYLRVSSGDPSPVTTFSLDDFAGSSTTIGSIATDRSSTGMDFDSPNSFYYHVPASSTAQPGSRGLWYWDNGVNTQLATMLFDDVGLGDVALSTDHDTLYVTMDDGDDIAGQSLYAWRNLDNTPTLLEIGEIGLSQVMGLAMDPRSGLLYGYDSTTEALYTIDTSTAVPSLVGASGRLVSGNGGMDFTDDGSTLVLGSFNDQIFKVDPATGLLSSAADQPFGTFISALSYRGSIPAPGALALLGVAGAFSRRRRR